MNQTQHVTRTRTFAFTRCEAAVACFAAFIATVLSMPALKDGYGTAQTISEGAVGTLGWVQGLGILALAAGCLIVARSLYGAGARLPAALIALSAFCTALLVVFPTDAGADARTLVGRIHYVLAAGAFLTSIGAMFSSPRAFRADALRCLAVPSLVLGAVCLVLVTALVIGAEPRGVVQRGLAACILAWMVALTLRLRAAPQPRITQRNPTCDVDVSIGSGKRAAGR